MATKKKMLQAAAGNAGGEALNVEDVFSTYLYDGNGSTQTITNGIDLDGEGGLVWLKQRTGAGLQHVLYDTERGSDSALFTSLENGAVTSGGTYTTTFNSGGFTTNTSGGNVNNSGQDNASWTFRKAPKFFTCVEYTGDGVAGREIAHNLGGTVGSIFVKKTNATREWAVYHRGVGATHYGVINNTDPFYDQVTLWNDTEPTSTHFTVGDNNSVNTNGDTYVAYLFAHNDGDGGFGPDGDQDIIKCGSYNLPYGSVDQVDVDLGFEPQWLLIKHSSPSNSNWYLYDTMRGATQDVFTSLYANTSGAEASQGNATYPNKITPTGFSINPAYFPVATAGSDYIYIAIRRGTKVPESGTEVFAPVVHNPDTSEINVSGGFTADAFISTRTGGTNKYITPRLLGGRTLVTNITGAETDYSANIGWDTQEGVNFTGFWSSSTDGFDWQWKRAPGFFDVVAYEWNGTATRNVEHNLGVPPEMYIVKRRNSTTGWYVRHKDFFGTNGSIVLNTTAATAQTGIFTTGGTTDTTFPVANDGTVNASGGTYIAYLFATLDGISKVGSYTGNGSSQTINCGFTSGARFILIKRTDSTGDWYVWDTERGIVAGNDPHLSLNTTAAEVTTDDSIDPDSSGFIVNQVSATNINVSSAEYIFYAVA